MNGKIEGSTPVTRENAVTRIWMEQLAISLRWAESHPVKLATIAIALPSLSIYYYLQAERIPLSIFSSDIISGLPSLLAIISTITLALFALALAPLTVMFEGAITEQDGSIRVFASSRKARWKKTRRWLLALMLPGVILAIAVVFLTKHEGHDSWGMPLAAILAFAVFIVASFLLGRKRPAGKHWLESTWFAIASNWTQMFLSILVMKQVLSRLPYLENFYLILAILIACMALIASFQLFAVYLIERASREGKIAANAFYSCLALVVALCAFPATGGRLAGAIASGSASGGRSCLQMSISGAASDYSELMQSGSEDSQRTRPIRVLIATSSRYYVRLKQEDDRTFIIPIDRVSQVAKCPEPNPRKRPH